jgi:ATP-binding cassette subfamily C (CFTR/MRP) protein 1
MKAFGFQLITPVLPRLILLLATFAQPILVNQMIYFVSDTELPIAAGWVIVGGFICVYVLITLSTSLYWEKAILLFVLVAESDSL